MNNRLIDIINLLVWKCLLGILKEVSSVTMLTVKAGKAASFLTQERILDIQLDDQSC